MKFDFRTTYKLSMSDSLLVNFLISIFSYDVIIIKSGILSKYVLSFLLPTSSIKLEYILPILFKVNSLLILFCLKNLNNL